MSKAIINTLQEGGPIYLEGRIPSEEEIDQYYRYAVGLIQAVLHTLAL